MQTTKAELTIGAKLFLFFILAIMLLGGVTMMAKAFRQLKESRQAQAWPTAPGRVTRSAMRESTDTQRSSAQQRESAPGTYSDAKIEYEFQVTGVTYHGSRLAAGEDMNAERSHVESVLRKYPVDQAVTVHYKSDDPSQCVLEPGGWGNLATLLPLSLLFTGAPLVLIWQLWKVRSPRTTFIDSM
jgi:hypothetical protein